MNPKKTCDMGCKPPYTLTVNETTNIKNIYRKLASYDIILAVCTKLSVPKPVLDSGITGNLASKN